MTIDQKKPWFPPRSRERIAISDVTVVPLTSPTSIPHQTVLINDGRIESILPSSEAELHAANVVDGTGKFLMPGLADMHVHYWDAGEFGMFLANGVTTVRNMWGAPFHLALQKQVEAGDFPGPRIITTSPIIDGPGPDGTTIWPGSAMAATTSDAEPMVFEFAARGYQQIKAYSWLKLDVLQALGQAANETGLRMVGHCPEGITYEQAIGAGMTCFEHLTGIVEGRLGGTSLKGLRMGSKEALLAVIDNVEMDAMRRLAHMLAEQDVWNCPTLVVWQGMAQDVDAALTNPLLEYEPATTVTSWNPANDFRQRSTTREERQEWLALAHKRIEIYRQIISILHQEGAPLILGTDTPNPFVYQGFAIHDELHNLVSAGLSNYDALRAGTVDAARFLGASDWGAIEEGNVADLLLVDADPLIDITSARRPEAVFVNGYHFSRLQLEALLQQRADSARGLAEGVADPAASRIAAAVSRVGPVPTEGEVVAKGFLVDRLVGSEAGTISYVHTRLPDGGWLVEETVSSRADGLRSWGGQSTARLELFPSLDIVSVAWRNESFLGVESIDVQLEDDGAYSVRLREIDGHESVSRVDGPLASGQELAFSATLLLLSGNSGDEREVPTLGIELDHPGVVPVRATQSHSGEWSVHINRNGTSVDQTFRFSDGGSFQRMEEQTWRGLREVLPLPLAL